MSGGTATARLVLQAPLCAVRLHDLRRSEREGPSPRLAWLLNLRAHQEREQQRHEALQATLRALQGALERTPQQVEQRLAEVSGLAVELGLAVAREVVGACLLAGVVDPAPIVARCLRSAVAGVEKARLTVALHPSDLPLVLNAVAVDPALKAAADRCSFEADPALARGAVRVDSEAGRLLYDPREVVERMAAEIRKGDA